MTRRERHKKILEFVDGHHEMSVREASELLNLSPATIRRDFESLLTKGVVKKIWGGIAAKPGSGVNHIMLPVAIRETKYALEKNKIAAEAASFVKDGDVIMVDGGTTTLAMAPYLANRKIRIITNSILIAYQIYKERENDSGAEVFLTGGLLFPDSGLLVGPQTSENIGQFHADWGFLSVGGIDGLEASNTDPQIVASERAIIRQSDKNVILADHSKFGHSDMCRICHLEDIDILVTDDDPSIGKYIDQLKSIELNIRLV